MKICLILKRLVAPEQRDTWCSTGAVGRGGEEFGEHLVTGKKEEEWDVEL